VTARAAVFALAVLLGSAAPAAGQNPQPLDVDAGGEVRDLAAASDRVVWIAGPTRGARLRTAIGGQAVDLPVEPLPDGRVDLGIGRDDGGRVVVTYARCAPALSGPPRDCDLFAFTFFGIEAQGEERELPYNLRNASEFAGAIDGNFLVTGRRFVKRTGGRDRFEYVYAGRADGSTRLHRLPTGPQDPDAVMPLRDLAIDFRRVTFVWRVGSGSARADTLGAKQFRIEKSNVVTAARDRDAVYYATSVPGEGGGTADTSMNLKFALSSRGRPLTDPDVFYNPFAVSGDRFFTPSDDRRRVREVPRPNFR
jgi:hypothetical protein